MVNPKQFNYYLPTHKRLVGITNYITGEMDELLVTDVPEKPVNFGNIRVEWPISTETANHHSRNIGNNIESLFLKLIRLSSSLLTSYNCKSSIWMLRIERQSVVHWSRLPRAVKSLWWGPNNLHSPKNSQFTAIITIGELYYYGYDDEFCQSYGFLLWNTRSEVYKGLKVPDSVACCD